MTERTGKITLFEVKNPIIIETSDVDNSLDRFNRLIQDHKGKLLQNIPTDKEIRVTFSIEKNEEQPFFNQLSELGSVRIPKEGYKDRQGNIVVIFKKM